MLFTVIPVTEDGKFCYIVQNCRTKETVKCSEGQLNETIYKMFEINL